MRTRLFIHRGFFKIGLHVESLTAFVYGEWWFLFTKSNPDSVEDIISKKYKELTNINYEICF